MSQQQQQQDKLINVGAGWVKQAQSGAEYLALKVNQDIPAGTWLKAFWAKDKQSERSPDLSLAGSEADGFQPVDYDGRGSQQGQQQNRGGGGSNRGQQQQRGGGNQRAGSGGYNNGGNRGYQQGQNRGGGGNRGQQQQRAQRYEDDINPDEIPF